MPCACLFLQKALSQPSPSKAKSDKHIFPEKAPPFGGGKESSGCNRRAQLSFSPVGSDAGMIQAASRFTSSSVKLHIFIFRLTIPMILSFSGKITSAERF